MPTILEVSYSDSAVTFVNPRTAKAETLATFEAIDDLQAIRTINAEIKGRDSVSQSSVSLLSHILNNPRLDNYKGVTPANEAIPKELKAAIRDIETEYLKPIFIKPLADKGNKPATIESAWQDFAKGLRDGGGYANAKSIVVQYFAICGKLPTLDNGKLLSVAAMVKLIANEKAKVTPETNEGIAGKLFALSKDVESRTDKTELGDYATAIAAMKSMLSTYEGLYSEALEKLTEIKGNNIADAAAMAMPKMDSVDDGQTLENKVFAQTDKVLKALADEYTAKWNDGVLSDTEYMIAMEDIGMPVEIVDEADMEALM